MFRPNTLLIVGAGASNEVGFPLGGTLVKQISKLLQLGRSNFQSTTGSSSNEIRRVLINHGGSSKAGKLIDLCLEMSLALEHADSIDAYLNDFRNDDDRTFCGKIAIAHEIAKAEARPPMAPDKSNIYNTLQWEKLETTWYSKFFRILKEGIGINDVEQIFDNISIICFNYDRTIEQYLFYALRQYYHITPQIAVELLRKLKLIHPYGTIGGFSYDLNEAHSNYGRELLGVDLIERAKTLRTVYENREDTAAVSEIRIEVEYAEQVVFLGFGFHPLNIDLLKCDNVVQNLRVYATGFELPEPAREIYLKRISSIFHKENTRCEALLREGRVILCNKKSNDLLSDYGLVFSHS